MKSFKIFISYSTTDRHYVDVILEKMGHDFFLVDNYTLENGLEVEQEIKNAIDQSQYFCFLISSKAIESYWCQKELDYISSRLLSGEISFMAYLIDNSININNLDNLGRNKWVKKYVLNDILQPNYVARLIHRRLRKDILKEFPSLAERANLFIGRDSEIQTLTLDFLKNDHIQKVALILSGVPHIGKRKIIRKFIEQRFNTSIYEDCDITLKDTDDISDFVLRLNDIVDMYSYEELLAMMNDKGKKKTLSLAIELLNDIHKKKEQIIIEDNMCIVKGNGKLTKWFLDLVKSENLAPHLHLCVASKFSPRTDLTIDYPQIITLVVQPLDKASMSALFYAYAKICNYNYNYKQEEEVFKYISGCPEQVYNAVDILKQNVFPVAIKQIAKRVGNYDNNFIEIIREVRKNASAFKLLLTISLFDFISYDALCEIIGRDCSVDLDELYHYSLFEFNGKNRMYISLNQVIIDYLRRNKIKLKDEEIEEIKDRTSQFFSEMDDKFADLSTRLFETKEKIRTSSGEIQSKYLMPSFVLKVIVEEYYDGNNPNVITLAYKILHGYKKNHYEEIIRSIHYWLCCALCREKDSRFLQEINYFDQDSYSYNFLYGFYWRHKRKYEKAESFYEEALAKKQYREDHSYISKAQHEMIIVQTHLGHYREALKLAEESYKFDSSNTYHIESYFRCLVRSASPDKSTLKELIKKMKNSDDVHRHVISKTMEAEYDYYIDHNFMVSYNKLSSLINEEKDSYKNYPLRSLRLICDSNGSQKIFRNVKKSMNIIEDEFFDEKAD